jgi:catechol 2,3-dioxygenase-like lactoylglutathione lyase family enzyme
VQIERFGHAAIRVRDLSVAESFYGSLLGFAVAHRYPDDNEVIFRVGNDDQLLVQAVGRQAAKADPALPGLHHIAFVVAGGEPGLQRMRERLEQNDVAYRTLDHGDHRSVYFHDPDGNQVELYHAPERIRRTPRATTALQCARAFVYGNARRVERALFEVVFEEGDGESLVSALSAYRNGDGGFGHALEPDLRAPSSQPLHTETALLMLKQAGVRRSDIADTCCDYLAGVARNDAALPAFTAGALDYPAAAHWQAGFGAQPSLDRTCGIVASLAWHGAKHPWFEAARMACLKHIESADIDEAHHLRYAFEAAEVLLDGATRNRTLTRLRSMLDRAEFFVAETPVARYGLTPLHFVPTQDTTARRVFDDALIERHLDDLGACQNDDGGWPIRFDPPSDGARIEWRGNWTLEALMTLRAWGRL